MTENRPDIPDDLKRRVRQRCRFACVVCQSPIVEYDHIIEYAKVKEHTYDNLVLLCPTCHTKKKNGHLPVQKIVQARESSEQRSRTAPEENYTEFKYVNVGSNIIEMFDGQLFAIDQFGEACIRFDKRLLISARIYGPSGDLAIEIVDNIYTLCRKGWDIEYVGAVLTFRNGHRDVFASLRFDDLEQTLHFTGKFRPHPSILVKIRENGIFSNNQLLARENSIAATNVGLAIIHNPGLKGGIAFQGGGAVYCEVQGCDTAFLNCTDCRYNVVHESRLGFVWDTDFLVDLTTRKREIANRAGGVASKK